MRQRAPYAAATWLSITLFALSTASCDGDSDAITEFTYEPLGVSDCVVWIHGKTDQGTAPFVQDGRGELSPNGNTRAGDGLEWQYGTDSTYAAARDSVAQAIENAGCEDVVLSGFSNGGAFVGKLYCRGESFGDRLRGVVIDDPVPDRGVLDCAPDPWVNVALYWTGALDQAAQPGAECARIEWTCEGDRLLGIDEYARELGTIAVASPFTDHQWYRESPQIDAWLGR